MMTKEERNERECLELCDVHCGPRPRDTVVTSAGAWEYCFDDREKELLEWALNELETSRDKGYYDEDADGMEVDDTPIAFDEVTLLLTKITER